MGRAAAMRAEEDQEGVDRQQDQGGAPAGRCALRLRALLGTCLGPRLPSGSVCAGGVLPDRHLHAHPPDRHPLQLRRNQEHHRPAVLDRKAARLQPSQRQAQKTKVPSPSCRNASINKYNAFKTFAESVELSTERHLFILPDNYHKGIRGHLLVQQDTEMQVEQSSRGGDSDDVRHLKNVVEWYQRHAQEIGFKKLTFSILTANE